MISSVSPEESPRGFFAEVTFSRGVCASVSKISLQCGTGVRAESICGRVLNQSPGRIAKGNLANLLIVLIASSVFNFDPVASCSRILV